jgi:HEAT repeats
MKKIHFLALGAFALMGLAAPAVQARWSVGVSIGGPVFYRPWGCCYPGPVYYYPPYPVYAAPPAVIVQPAPVVAAPAPVVAAPGQTVPPLQRVAGSDSAAVAVSSNYQVDLDRYIQQLADPNDQVRLEAALQLGKMKADRAVDPVAATLAGDRSPAVREAAARALGLIGSSRGLTALKYAAQADSDRDVRHSAQFAVEIIHSNLKH